MDLPHWAAYVTAKVISACAYHIYSHLLLVWELPHSHRVAHHVNSSECTAYMGSCFCCYRTYCISDYDTDHAFICSLVACLFCNDPLEPAFGLFWLRSRYFLLRRWRGTFHAGLLKAHLLIWLSEVELVVPRVGIFCMGLRWNRGRLCYSSAPKFWVLDCCSEFRHRPA